MPTLYIRPNCCADCMKALELSGGLDIEIVQVEEVFPCTDIKRYPKLVVGETGYIKEECLIMLRRMIGGDYESID